MIVGIGGPSRSGKGTCASALRRWVQIDFADALRRTVVKVFPDVVIAWSPEKRNEVPIDSAYLHDAVWSDGCKSWLVDTRADDRLVAAARTAKLFTPDAGVALAKWLTPTSRVRRNEHTHPTIRQLLQYFGTEVGRSVDPNYWVNEWESTRRLIPAGWAYDKQGGYETPTYTEGRLPGFVATDVRFRNEAEHIRACGGIVVKLIAPWVQVADGIPGHASDVGLPDDVVNVHLEIPPCPKNSDGFPGWRDNVQTSFIEAVRPFVPASLLVKS